MTILTPEASYRKVLLSGAPLKLKLAALERLERPSERFLSQLLRTANLQPKLRLAITDKLRDLKRRKAIDKLLQSERTRLGEQLEPR